MGVALGWIFFFAVFLLAMWVLLFSFTVMIPGALQLFLLNKFAPKFVRDLAGLEDGEDFSGEKKEETSLE